MITTTFMTQKSILTQPFETIFRTHFSSVKRFVFALLKSEEDAEDITQDVFTKLWMKPEIWNEENEIKGYLFAMAKNLTFNFIKHKRLEENYQDEQIRENLIKEVSVSDDPLNDLYYKEMQLAVKLKLQQLPPKRKQIFEMSRILNMSHKEIAEKLDISERTVEQHIYKALQDLKKITFLLFFCILTK